MSAHPPPFTPPPSHPFGGGEVLGAVEGLVGNVCRGSFTAAPRAPARIRVCGPMRAQGARTSHLGGTALKGGLCVRPARGVRFNKTHGALLKRGGAVRAVDVLLRVPSRRALARAPLGTRVARTTGRLAYEGQ